MKLRTVIPGVIIGILAGCSESDPAAHAEANEKATALVKCESAIRKSLKSPGTAKFSGVLGSGMSCQASDAGISEARTCGVKGWVDATNGFGGTVRNDYICMARHTGASWSAVEFELY